MCERSQCPIVLERHVFCDNVFVRDECDKQITEHDKTHLVALDWKFDGYLIWYEPKGLCIFQVIVSGIKKGCQC